MFVCGWCGLISTNVEGFVLCTILCHFAKTVLCVEEGCLVDGRVWRGCVVHSEYVVLLVVATECKKYGPVSG